ncbi:MAG: GHMP family kinase ATP-binding protein, partial [Bdellovibrionota bacterium]
MNRLLGGVKCRCGGGLACLAGLVAANSFSGCQASLQDILCLATEMEGHPDNVTAALLGGLV